MPRQVDHEARRRAIIEATIEVIGESGMDGLSFRSVADRLGGSTTVVTHYYPTMNDLVDDIAVRLVNSWDEELASHEAGLENPFERLWALLSWLLPHTKNGRYEERARIALLADELTGNQHRAQFEAHEQRIRGYLREHVACLVAEGDVERIVELLRVVANGIVLSSCEHPARWRRGRQLAVMRLVLSGLGLTDSARGA